jgi:hypothetical protein
LDINPELAGTLLKLITFQNRFHIPSPLADNILFYILAQAQLGKRGEGKLFSCFTENRKRKTENSLYPAASATAAV